MPALNPGNHNVYSLYNECICECDLCGRQFRGLIYPVCFLKMSQIIITLNTTNELNKGGFSKV